MSSEKDNMSEGNQIGAAMLAFIVYSVIIMAAFSAVGDIVLRLDRIATTLEKMEAK